MVKNKSQGKNNLKESDTLYGNFNEEDICLETRDPIEFGYWCKHHMKLHSNEINFMRKYLKDVLGQDIDDKTLIYQAELFDALDALKKSPYYGWNGQTFNYHGEDDDYGRDIFDTLDDQDYKDAGYIWDEDQEDWIPTKLC